MLELLLLVARPKRRVQPCFESRDRCKVRPSFAVHHPNERRVTEATPFGYRTEALTADRRTQIQYQLTSDFGERIG